VLGENHKHRFQNVKMMSDRSQPNLRADHIARLARKMIVRDGIFPHRHFPYRNQCFYEL
jgi:hypothetical protein